MAAKSKSGKVRGAGRNLTVPSGRRGRGTTRGYDAWDQTAQVPEQRDAEIDCQRIVQSDGGRSLPLYYDDFN